MRILVLSYEYPPVGGGGGRVAKQVAGRLAARGHEIRVLTGGFRGLANDSTEDGVRVLRVHTPRAKMDTCTVSEMGMHVAGAFPSVLVNAWRWRPDVIHAHFAVPTGALAWGARVLGGVPYVITAHLGDVPGGVPEQTDQLFRWLGPPCRAIWRRAAACTAVSSFVARLAREAYGVSPVVIPNGVERDPEPGFLDPPIVRILFVGRFSIQKAPALAVRAAAQLREQNWRLDMVGDGPLRVEVEEAIAATGLTDRVHLHGWCPQERVTELMRQSQILLMTSHQEGLPMAAIEAINHGMTVVATDIEGLHDVVRNGENGILCERSPHALAEALDGLIADPQRRRALRQAAHAHAASFGLDETAARYEELLRAHAKGGSGAFPNCAM